SDWYAGLGCCSGLCRSSHPLRKLSEQAHWMSNKVIKLDNPASERVVTYSQWRLIAMRFARHKLAVFSSILLLVMYLVAAFADFVIPYSPNEHNAKLLYAPPTHIYFADENGFSLQPFTYPLKSQRNMQTLQLEFVEDHSKRDYIQFFV